MNICETSRTVVKMGANEITELYLNTFEGYRDLVRSIRKCEAQLRFVALDLSCNEALNESEFQGAKMLSEYLDGAKDRKARIFEATKKRLICE